MAFNSFKLSFATYFTAILWIRCYSAVENKTESRRFVIGALLPVRSYTNYVSDYMIPQVEALHFAIDKINKDDKILPNITLEVDIRDYQSLVEVAYVQTLKLAERLLCSLQHYKEIFKCSDDKLLVGVILPDDEHLRPRIESTLSWLEIQQVSFSEPVAGIPDNNAVGSADPYTTNYYLKSTSSGNLFMTEVIFEILAKYNITCVSLFHFSESERDFNAVQEFYKMAAINGICIADVINKQQFYVYPVKENLWEIMPSYDNVDVIVCFCTEDEINELYEKIHADGSRSKKFIIIGGDGRIPTNRKTNSAVTELFLSTKSKCIKEFDDYFASLNVENNKRNPWFKGFWQDYFNCTFEVDNNSTSKCTGTEKLSSDPKQCQDISNIIKSVYVLAYALHDSLKNYPDLNAESLRNAVSFSSDTKFTLYGDEVKFDLNGLPTSVGYDIYNFQGSQDNSSVPVKIGEYTRTGEIIWVEEGNMSYRALKKYKQLEIHEKFSFPQKLKHSCNQTCVENARRCLKSFSC